MKRNAVLLAVILLAAFLVPVTGQTRSSSADARDASKFRDRLQQIYDAWSELDPAKTAKFYAKDANLVFFDIAPLKYAGWNEYAAGVPKELSDYKSVKITMDNDFQAHRHGNLTWATCTWTADLTKKDGAVEKLAGRHTLIWEKRGNDWLVVHEHLSVPLGPLAK